MGSHNNEKDYLRRTETWQRMKAEDKEELAGKVCCVRSHVFVCVWGGGWQRIEAGEEEELAGKVCSNSLKGCLFKPSRTKASSKPQRL